MAIVLRSRILISAFVLLLAAELSSASARGASQPQGGHVPRIDALRVVSAKADDALVEFVVTVFDEANDIDLTSVAGRATVVCRNAGWGLSLGKPDKVVKRNATSNEIWFSNGQPGTRVEGSCEFSVYVEDKAGKRSDPAKTTAEFK